MDDKVLDIKASIKPSTYDPPLNFSPTYLLTSFHPISSVKLADIVFKAKSSSCESDCHLSLSFLGSVCNLESSSNSHH